MRERVKQFINDFRSIPFCCHRIIELNMELEEMNHSLLGISHRQEQIPTQMVKNKRTGEMEEKPVYKQWMQYSMPTYQKTYTSPLALMEEITVVENEINYYRRRINECKAAELLSNRDQNILFDLYFFRMFKNDCAEKYGYTPKGLIKHIDAELGKLL